MSESHGSRVKSLINLETVKTLVAIHGARPTARKTGINHNTILSWIKRYHWKLPNKSNQCIASNEVSTAPNIKTQSPSDVVAAELESNRLKSALSLSRFSAVASREAEKHPEKLKITRKVKDLADIHSTLWPNERAGHNTFIQLGVLIGRDAPRKVRESDSPNE